MGQKTHPYGFRLGIIKTWDSKWFASKSYAKFLYEDIIVKKISQVKTPTGGYFED